jgi:signal transduction histidine kinase
LVAEAIHSKEPILGDLERSEAAERIYLNLVAPLLTGDETGGVAVGAVLVRIDPNQFLYPLIRSWPIPSPTAETLLVRREGNEVVFLNDLRHQENTALRKRFQINDLKAPCVMAARGEEGVLDGVDYRGFSVLSVVKRVSDTPWFLIAKVDTEEVYAPVRERVPFMLIIAGLLLAGVGLTFLLIWSHQKSILLREARDSLEQRVKERTADLQAMNQQLTGEVERRIQAEEEYRSVAVRLAETEESERSRLARELHDSVGQSLTALSFSITTAVNRLPAGSPQEVISRLEDSAKLVSDTMSRVRDVMVDLMPPLLDDHGLVPVLRWYCREFSERSGTETVVTGDEKVPRLPPPAEIALFRIAQEALMNVMQHANASEVTVELEATAEAVRMTIADNGVGFSPETATSPRGKGSGWGMLSMRERAEMVGGRFQALSSPGSGT